MKVEPLVNSDPCVFPQGSERYLAVADAERPLEWSDFTLSTLSYRRSDDAPLSAIGHLAWRWMHDGQSLLVISGALLGAAGAGLTMMRIPAGVYVTLAGLVWLLLCTVLLVSIALRGPARRSVSRASRVRVLHLPPLH